MHCCVLLLERFLKRHLATAGHSVERKKLVAVIDLAVEHLDLSKTLKTGVTAVREQGNTALHDPYGITDDANPEDLRWLFQAVDELVEELHVRPQKWADSGRASKTTKNHSEEADMGTLEATPDGAASPMAHPPGGGSPILLTGELYACPVGLPLGMAPGSDVLYRGRIAALPGRHGIVFLNCSKLSRSMRQVKAILWRLRQALLSLKTLRQLRSTGTA